MKTSKIKSIEPSGSFESKYGKMFKFIYGFEDGTVLTANSKSESCPFKVGDEVEYEVKVENTYGKQGTVGKPKDPNQPQGGGGFKGQPKDQDAILYQTCLKITAEVHGGNAMIPTPEQVSEYAMKLAKLAKANIELLKK